MCGIFACFGPQGIEHLAIEKLEQSTNSVKHRGPDNTGFYRDKYCFFGHTRLSIVDTSVSGNQPFHFNQLVLTYNGEIFNYIELREELKAVGYSFDTSSDTEVVLKAFDHWGSECFEKFNGMWAIVIYDRKNQVLTVSRDRFGQKPLFASQVNGTFFFSSEAHQILDHTSRGVNFSLIEMFLKEGTYEGNGQTFFSEIEEFPKAHYFVISNRSECRSVRYWDYPSGEIDKTTQGSFAQFENLLKDAVGIRLRADVPLGMLLSGGVDSTIVATMAREIAGEELSIEAFTYASRDKDDESQYAAAVAKVLKLNLVMREQDSNPLAFVERLRALVSRMGRGHSSPAIVSIDYLYESVADAGIKVAIDGQGADELLAGYKLYYLQIISSQLAQGRFRQAFANLKSFFSPGSQLKYGFLSAILLHLRTTLPPAGRKVMRFVYGYEQMFASYQQNPRVQIIPIIKSTIVNRNAVNRLLQKQHNVGLENLLFYGDIVAMNNSVENRSPFMDHRVVEFCFKHDELLKVFNGQEKYALRRLPQYQKFKNILDRDKIGFSSDIKFQTKKYMVQQLKQSPILDWPIFSNGLTKFVHSKRPLRDKYERFLFRLFQVHLWCEIFIQCVAIPGRPSENRT